MEVLIEFVGGPHDGETWSTDSPDKLQADKVRKIAWLVGAGLNIAERRESPPGNLMTFRFPSAVVAERAKAEGWSEAKIKALMPYYEYEVREVRETDGLAMLTARYMRLAE